MTLGKDAPRGTKKNASLQILNRKFLGLMAEINEQEGESGFLGVVRRMGEEGFVREMAKVRKSIVDLM